ncbi:MAG: hypothetical protein JWM68_4621 [Verrucomicrobiales bacterium]|nr:hypothetical protein [Verrucomicrobiales bacterium]
MQRSLSLLFSFVGLGILLTGCVGPEKKLGRGINNFTELARGGEISRSMEQTGIYNGADVAYTTGFLHGFNRSLARTAIGAFEIVTSPFPPYDDVKIFPMNPVYPSAYAPGLPDDSMFATDVSSGFSGGEVAPFIPGSRFRVFDEH